MTGEDGVVQIEDLVQRAHVVALPMRVRFRGIETREALLLAPGEECAGWAEWSPFVEYEDAEAAMWLRAALEPAAVAAPATVRVNATVPAVTPDAVPDLLARFPGTRTAKVKVAEAGQTLADDVARVRAVRDAMGAGARIRVDANGAWSLAEATAALEALAAFGLEYAEQPVARVADLAELRRRLDGLVPIAADESIRKPADPLEVVRAGAADVIMLKRQPLGGATRARDIVAAVRAEAGLGIRFVTSSALETSVGLAAAARLAAWVDDLGGDLDHGLGTAALLAADVVREPLQPTDGRIPLREVVPEPELLARHAAPAERTAWWLARLRRCAALLTA
ncbi:MAG TPA: o-succinylbenzoate synthase [Microbacteriaceae bacterium]|nr:o-succinylbenzoate synthase [Microbacteriaceae bacterium]